MASQAQILANYANASHSTGPRTDSGKAASARNATTHGFTSGVFQIDAEDRPYFDAVEMTLHAYASPEGALELDALREVRDAFFRLRQIRKICLQLYSRHGVDPLVHPESAAAVRQLTRYRAAAEMQLYRALDALMDLQLTRVGRMVHLTAKESSFIGPLVTSDVFAFQPCDYHTLGRPARERLEHNLDFVDFDEAARLAAIGLTCQPVVPEPPI